MRGPSGDAPIAFAGSPLDRADNLRADPEALAGMMNWKARLLALDEMMPAMDDTGRLAWGTLADAPEDAELVFLGLDRSDGGEKPCFAAVPDEGDAKPRMANPRLRSLMSTLDPGDLALYGTVSPSAQLVSGDVTDVTTKSGKSGRSIVIWIGLSFEE